MRSIKYYRELSRRWVEYSSGLRGLSVALKDIQAFVKPCLHSEFFFSLFLSSNKVIECHSTQGEGVPEGGEDMEPDPQHQPSGPKI